MSNTRTRKRPPPKKKAPPAQPQGRKFPVWWIAGGVVAVALIVAVLLSVDTGGSDSAGEFGDPVVTGEALDVFTEPFSDTAVGAPIPAVAGTSFDGSAVAIDPGDGPQAIVFLAHWCPHCQNEVPMVQAFLDSGGADGLDATFKSVVTSTSSARENYPPSAWLERENWTVPVIVDDTTSSVGRAFGLSAFPYWVFTDADGNVTARRAGSLPMGEVEALILASANR